MKTRSSAKSSLALTGALALSLFLVTACSTGTGTNQGTSTDTSLQGNAGLKTNITASDCLRFTNDCQQLRTEVQGDLQTRVQNLRQGSDNLVLGVRENGGVRVLTPSTQLDVAKVAVAPSLASQLLGNLSGSLTPSQFLNVKAELEAMLDTAEQNLIDTQASVSGELGSKFDAALDADSELRGQLPTVNTLIDGVADLEARIRDLNASGSLSGDAQLALDKLAFNLDVLADQIEKEVSLGADADALLNSNGNVQLALQNVQESLADANANLAGNAGGQLNLNGAAAVDGLDGTVNNVSGSAGVTGGATGTTNGGLLPGVNTGINGSGSGVIDGTLNGTGTLDGTLDGAVDSTLNGGASGGATGGATGVINY